MGDKTRWAVELPGGRWEIVMAERVSIESGAIVFSNGDVFSREFVAAYGPGAWAFVTEAITDADSDEE